MNIFLSIIILLLSGCAITPQIDAPLAVYNFGLQHTPDTSKSTNPFPIKSPSLLIADATSPIWLDSQAIQYRLTYNNPMQLYSYANSRWAATPATMLTLQVRNYMLSEKGNAVIKPSDGAQADYMLQIELNEFSQVFETIDSSNAVIRLNASLIKRKTRLLIAQRNFSVQQKASTTDAAGAVKALAEASNQLTKKLGNWIIQEIIDNSQ
jgi:cholesterol transport system auxiliary component